MRRLAKLQGVFVPLLMPMLEDRSIDIEGTKSLAQTFLNSPSFDGLFILGSTGEYMHLTDREKENVVKAISEVGISEKAIIYNVSGLQIGKVSSLIDADRQSTYVFAFVITDNYTDSQEALSFFRRISQIDIPFMVYWTPHGKYYPSTGFLKEMINFPTFVGLKDSSRNMENFGSICARFGNEISIFQGVETLHLPSLASGSAGVIGGGLNLYPRLLSEITQAFRNHQLKTARQLQKKVIDNWNLLNKDKSFRWVCKKIWKEKGLIKGKCCREGKGSKFK